MGDGYDKRRQKLVDAILRVDPAASPDFYTFARHLRQTQELFLARNAAALEAPLNAYLATLPQATLDEKRALVKEAVAVMRMLGVAIRTPSGEMGCLGVTVGDDAEHGQFAIYVNTDRGPRYIQRSVNLMPLELVGQVDRHIRHDTLAMWRERVGAPGSSRHRS